MALVFPAPALIKNVKDPVDGQDVATKTWVENAITNPTGNVTIANVIVTNTSNLGNSATGNLITANYFVGDGSNISNISGANITGTVANANYAGYAGNVTFSAQSNITSLGTLTSLNVSGNVTFTGARVNLGNVSNLKISGGTANYVLKTDGQGNLSWVAQQTVDLSSYATQTYVNTAISNLVNSAPTVLDTLGELANALGNDASFATTITNSLANKFNTSDFTSNANTAIDNRVTKSFVDNLAVVANIANTAYSVAGANVTGTVANANYAAFAGTVVTSSQPNITSVGTLTGLNVSGNLSFTGSNAYFSNIANLKIPGGAANYVITTDGNGNLSWGSIQAGTSSSVIIDTFVGNGVQTTFTLSTTPANANVTTVNYNGVILLRESYSISGANLVFNNAPAANAKLEVTTISVSLGGSNYGNSNVANYLPTYTGNLSANIANFTSVNMSGNIIPVTGNTYSLGNATNRWKDLYLQGNTIYLGNSTFSESDILPFNLTIAPEVLVINADAPFAGNDIHWLWTWTQSTLPYARQTITNQQQVSVPLYRQGTYQVNNFANEVHGNMDQRHMLYLKWIDGPGLDNLVSWSVNNGNVTHSHPNINGGANTTVQRTTITVPSTVTLPTLNLPSNVTYNVAATTSNVFTFTGSGIGENRTLGPLYRGATYTFNLDSSLGNDNKFYLTTDNGTAFQAGQYIGEYTSGVTGSRGNGAPGANVLTFVVPNNAPDVLYYQSANVANRHGPIIIKDLAVETNINGNPILYFQHGREGHKTPVEIRPIPSMVNQMCLVYDASVNQFVPQDMATYIENTPSFKNKIQEVAGTATLIAPDGVAVVPTVLIVEDVSYLPIFDNKDGDIAFDEYTNTIYVWAANKWNSTKPASVGTVTTAAQPNITSVGTLSNLTVSGNASFTGANVSLGNVANVKVTGGSSGQFLQTDGTGNLTFATVSTTTPDPIHPFLFGF